MTSIVIENISYISNCEQLRWPSRSQKITCTCIYVYEIILSRFSTPEGNYYNILIPYKMCTVRRCLFINLAPFFLPTLRAWGGGGGGRGKKCSREQSFAQKIVIMKNEMAVNSFGQESCGCTYWCHSCVTPVTSFIFEISSSSYAIDFVCVCVCVCMRACMCVIMCAHVCEQKFVLTVF